MKVGAVLNTTAALGVSWTVTVTDMVYIAGGRAGVVPSWIQVRTVLPNGSNSVKGVTVVWINGETRALMSRQVLEKGYFKYSTKLAISCGSDDTAVHAIEDNVEINAVVQISNKGHGAGPEAARRKGGSIWKNRFIRGYYLCFS
jgi:hypothetical protein